MTITSPAPSPGLPYDRLAAPSSARAGAGRLGRVWTGSPQDPRWARPALLSLLAATGLLYIVNLAASGYANAFYAAAAQAGSTSWKAFFFGSFDGGNAITVDKPPASLWVTGISARIFGVNSWSLLVPEALMGVAAVGLLYMTVKRRFGAAAGLLAGAVLAVTPVATLMFRFNNPDALMVLLLVASAYTLTRAMEKAETKWMLWTGVLIGFAFLSKMLQAFLVVPGFALVYLIAAPTTFWHRVRQTLYGGIAMFVAAGWWVAIVQLWPKSSRPYIGGSQDNSILNLIFGYNGFGRITGNETGSVGGGGAGGAGGAGGRSMWGITGVTRMFNTEIGGQVSWLIPSALIFLVGLLWLSRRMPRTDGRRAALILWGSWLVVTGLVFDFMSGIFHPYYTVALAPAIGALVGIGAVSLWKARHMFAARAVLASGIGAAAIWGYLLLHRTASWNSWLRFFVLLAGLAVAGYVLAMPRMSRVITVAVATLAISVGLAGPFAYSVATAASAKSGAIPSAGPAGQGFGPGGRGRRAGRQLRSPASTVPAERHRQRRRVRRSQGRDGRRRCRRWRRPAERRDPLRGAEGGAAGQRQELHLGSGHRRLEQRGRAAACDRQGRDGHRRLQRHRPEPDPGAVRAVGQRRQDPLLHRWREPWQGSAGSAVARAAHPGPAARSRRGSSRTSRRPPSAARRSMT